MDFFKFFDWPRKQVANGDGGGNIVAVDFPNADTDNSSSRLVFTTIKIKSSGRPVEVKFQAGVFRMYETSATMVRINAEIYKNGVLFRTIPTINLYGQSGTQPPSIPYSVFNFVDLNPVVGENEYLFEIVPPHGHVRMLANQVIAMEL